MKKRTMVLLALLCTCLWGSAGPLIKTGYACFGIAAEDTGSILLFAGLRFTLAGILVLLYVFLSARCGHPQKGFTASVAWLALFQTAGQYFFYYLGLAFSSGVTAAVLTGTGAFFTLLASVFLFQLEKMTAAKAGGCLLGFLGILFLNGFSFSGTGLLSQGGLLILLSQICSAVSACLIQIFGRKNDPALLSGSQFLAGGLALCLLSLFFHPSLSLNSGLGLVVLLGLALISAAAYTIWGYLLKRNPVSQVTVFDSFIPAAGVVLSALLLQEWQQALQISTLLALACILSGIWLVNRSGPEKSSG